MGKTPRKALGSKSPVEQDGKRFCPIKRDEEAAQFKAKREEKLLARRNAMLKHAPTILDLAEKALVAVQALMAAESAAKEEIQEKYTLFSSDESTLEDAEEAICIARFSAQEVLNGKYD